MRTVFVTGAGGFVGGRLVDYLRDRGYDVVAGVRNRARKLAYERQNVKALVCDVADSIGVARAVAGVRPDGVVHLAGMSRPAEVTAEPLEAYQSLVTSWANVLDAVRRAVPRARVVCASAAEVYGNAGGDGQLLREDTPLQPLTTFGSLKAAAESVARTFHRDYHLDVTIARPFNYTGPGQPERFFFPAVAHRLASWDTAVHGHELRLPDLACRRDLLHIEDVVAAYERLLREGRPNEAYNICSGQAPTCRELIEGMVAELGCDIHLADSPPEHDSRTAPVLCGDNAKLRAELGWAPTRSAQDAVRDLLASCRKPTAALAT